MASCCSQKKKEQQCASRQPQQPGSSPVLLTIAQKLQQETTAISSSPIQITGIASQPTRWRHSTEAFENVCPLCSGAFEHLAVFSGGKFSKKNSSNNSYTITIYLGVTYVKKQIRSHSNMVPISRQLIFKSPRNQYAKLPHLTQPYKHSQVNKNLLPYAPKSGPVSAFVI